MIELREVTKVYRTGRVEVHALQEVSVTIGQSEMLAIMGPSGSGKTTLMNVLGCLDAPTSGQYVLKGEEVERLGDDQLAEIRNRQIGFVFQTYNLLPRLTAIANVQLPLLYGRVRNSKKQALDALERVGLGHRAYHRPTELSGGEQQRVGIARALVKDPAILLADEPTGNLDTRSSVEVVELLSRLNREAGITVVIVTHEPEVAAHTRRTISMRDGRIVGDELASGTGEAPPSNSTRERLA